MDRGTASVVMGYENAAKLFGDPEKAVGISITVKNKRIKRMEKGGGKKSTK